MIERLRWWWYENPAFGFAVVVAFIVADLAFVFVFPNAARFVAMISPLLMVGGALLIWWGRRQ